MTEFDPSLNPEDPRFWEAIGASIKPGLPAQPAQAEVIRRTDGTIEIRQGEV